MSSAGKRKTTMAKRDRENKLRERREDKKAKKAARKLASQAGNGDLGVATDEHFIGPLLPPALEELTPPLPDV